jgi:hypothetical protein
MENKSRGNITLDGDIDVEKLTPIGALRPFFQTRFHCRKSGRDIAPENYEESEISPQQS